MGLDLACCWAAAVVALEVVVVEAEAAVVSISAPCMIQRAGEKITHASTHPLSPLQHMSRHSTLSGACLIGTLPNGLNSEIVPRKEV